MLARTAAPCITLVTCYPFYYIGDAPRRYIVRCVLKEIAKSGRRIERRRIAINRRRNAMYWLAVRRTIRWVSVFLVFVFLAAPGPCSARPLYAGGHPYALALSAVPGVMDLLLFGILGLAAATAAVAVRMVRRWH